MGKLLIVLFLFQITTSHAKMTIPNNLGDLCTTNDPDFKEYRYKEQIPICERNVTPNTKNKVCERDGVKDRRNYIVNHSISLFAGGSNSVKNLYCQPKERNTANEEYELYQKLKDGEINIEEVWIKLKRMNDDLITELNGL